MSKVLLTEAQTAFLLHSDTGLKSFTYYKVPEAPMRRKRVTIPATSLYDRGLGQADANAAQEWTDHYRPEYLRELRKLVDHDGHRVYGTSSSLPRLMAKMVSALPPQIEGRKLPEFILDENLLDEYTADYALAAMTQQQVAWPPTFAGLKVSGLAGFGGVLLHRPGAISVGCASSYVERGQSYDSDNPHIDIYAGFVFNIESPNNLVFSLPPA